MYCKYLDQDNHEYTHKYLEKLLFLEELEKVILFLEQENGKSILE